MAGTRDAAGGAQGAMKRLYLPLNEMLCVARFRSLQGTMVTRPPMGALGFKWRPYYTRAIHRNGYQKKQRDRLFAEWGVWRQRRIRAAQNSPVPSVRREAAVYVV